MPRVALVTDSTAGLPPSMAAERGIQVVPLEVVLGSEAYAEGGAEASPAAVAQALRERQQVSTSRPTPAAFLAAYRRAAEAGAASVVSVHISGEMSGTLESAQMAAREADLPVEVVDSRQVGFATGLAVLAAAEALEAGADAREAAEVARRRAVATTSLFYVDTLEYLRRGGRVGTAAALLGGALAVKPLLRIEDGRVRPLEKVRTAGRALTRLEDLAVAAAGTGRVDAYVAHLASPDRAGELRDRLAARLAANLEGRPVWCGEVGVVLAAHVGPGMVAACVAPRVSLGDLS